MNTLRTSHIAWALAATTTVLALVAWLPSINTKPTAYDVSAILGLVAFGLMWGHYVSGAVRRTMGDSQQSLQTYYQATSYVVLVSILLHPAIFYSALFRDGLGLPPQSFLSVYTDAPERIAISMGTAAFFTFLLFELKRWYKQKSWWYIVEWANIVAMLFILWHGFKLGGEAGSGWFVTIWTLYAISFVAAVAYNHHYDAKQPQKA